MDACVLEELIAFAFNCDYCVFLIFISGHHL